MKPFEKCPICGGDLENKQVEKLLRGGDNTVSMKVSAEVCTHCGERLYAEDVVLNETAIIHKRFLYPQDIVERMADEMQYLAVSSARTDVLQDRHLKRFEVNCGSRNSAILERLANRLRLKKIGQTKPSSRPLNPPIRSGLSVV